MIDTKTPFVALPPVKALDNWIEITNPANGKSCRAQVLDVGRWNELDDAYVFGGARPASESGHSVSGHGTNGVGIDLRECVWYAPELNGNTDVEWEFVECLTHPEPVPYPFTCPLGYLSFGQSSGLAIPLPDRN